MPSLTHCGSTMVYELRHACFFCRCGARIHPMDLVNQGRY